MWAKKVGQMTQHNLQTLTPTIINTLLQLGMIHYTATTVALGQKSPLSADQWRGDLDPCVSQYHPGC